MAAVFGSGAVALLPALALVDTGDLLTANGLALAAYLGVVTTTLAYILFAKGLQRIGASETATLTLAEPVTAMVARIRRPRRSGRAPRRSPAPPSCSPVSRSSPSGSTAAGWALHGPRRRPRKAVDHPRHRW